MMERRAWKWCAALAAMVGLCLPLGACQSTVDTNAVGSGTTSTQGNSSTDSKNTDADTDDSDSAAQQGSGDSSSSASHDAGGAVAGDLATTVLAALPVKGRAPKTGYSRDQFGAAWADVDHNGCDTRNDILNRDLTDKTYKANTHDCVVATGKLADPYTGKTIDFVRGQNTSSAVQIDHVVALSDAWQKGAQQLSADQREQLANDPYNLLAVDGPSNQQKSDGDAATWLPANKSFRCAYVARQIGVKHKYSLWVTQSEHDAMTNVLASCPDQRVPEHGGVSGDDTAGDTGSTDTGSTDTGSSDATTGDTTTGNSSANDATQQDQSPSSTDQQTTSNTGSEDAAAGTDTNGDVYYQNCSAARAAGAAPLYKGQPGYRAKLDRDGDGVACE